MEEGIAVMDNGFPDELTLRYDHLISEIDYIMSNLEHGRYYEKSGAKSDGYLANNISELRDYLDELLYLVYSDDKNKLNIKNPAKILRSYDEIKKVKSK